MKKRLIITILTLCTLQLWAQSNPIENGTTETINGTVWDLGSAPLYVGSNTVNNTMIVTNGGYVGNGYGYIGFQSGGDNNTVAVSGSGSVWTNENVLYLGYYGRDNSLIISDGGEVEASYSFIGSRIGADNNSVTVSGAGSLWKNKTYSSTTVIGEYGSGNSLTISDGGEVQSYRTEVGAKTGADNNTVTVSDAGSLWKNTSYVKIGEGSSNSLIVSNGGEVRSSTGYIGYLSGSDNNSVTVGGAGSLWTNSSVLYIGRAGSDNSLIISNGGEVRSRSGHVGFIVATNNFVTVSGADSKWNNTYALSVGNNSSGVGNFVTVSNGGMVSAASVTIYANNSFNLQGGGTLSVSNDFNANQAGDFNWNGGTLEVGGQLTGISMLAANQRLAATDLSGDLTVHGTFAPGNSPADSLLDGALVLESDGTLEMELAGYLLGDEYDRLTVTGVATLDGTLDVVFLDGFTPTNVISFDLFNWDGGVNGTFAATNLPTLTGDLSWDTSDLYNGGSVSVVPEPATAGMLVLSGLLIAAYRRFFGRV